MLSLKLISFYYSFKLSPLSECGELPSKVAIATIKRSRLLLHMKLFRRKERIELRLELRKWAAIHMDANKSVVLLGPTVRKTSKNQYSYQF